MSESADEKTLRDALRVAFRRWPVFLLAAAAFAFAVLCSAHYWPLKYTGLTYFERSSDPSVDNLKTESFEALKRTLVYRLGGREALERVIEDLSLTKGSPHGADGQLTLVGSKARQELVADFQKRLKIDFQVQSPTIDLVSVEFTHENAELASKVPNLLVSNYIEWAHKSIYDSLAASGKFLDDQASKCKRRLDELEQQKMDFEVKHAGMFPDSPDALQTRINTTLSDLDTLRVQQNKAKKEVARLESLVRPAEQTKPDSPKPNVPRRPTQVEIDYAQLQMRLQLMKQDLETDIVVRGYTEMHPEVRTLREGIKRTEVQLAALEAKLPANYEPPPEKGSPSKAENVEMALAGARSEVEVTTAEIERLENRLKDFEGLMTNFTAVRQQYLEILNKMRDQQAEAARWKARQDEVQMALDAEVAKRRTHLESVQTAEKQLRPSSPQLMMVLGFAFVGSLAFGGGVVFLLNFLDRSISTTEDASKYFNIAVHGVIGEITTSGHRRRRKVRRYLVWPAVSLLVLGMLGLATVSIFLWLRSPERFQEWRAAPVKFVWDHAIAAAGQILQRIGS